MKTSKIASNQKIYFIIKGAKRRIFCLVCQVFLEKKVGDF